MSLLDVLRLLRQLGATVAPVRRTGEVRVSHPAVIKSVRVNARRKEPSRALTVFLKRVQEACDAAACARGD